MIQHRIMAVEAQLSFYYSNILKITICYAKIWANVCEPIAKTHQLWGKLYINAKFDLLR